MSGLLAFVSACGAATRHRAAVAAALEAVHHRGPDETGVTVIGDSMVLGFKRLAVVDVAASHQPLPFPGSGYDAGRYMILFDGKVYNHAELREELAREHGATFVTQGDAEVVVAGYHYWGEQVVTRLRGMFAVVIFDTHRGTVWGARDPFGVKPLYYLAGDEGVYFASEKKALLPFLAPDRTIDTATLSHYLTMQYVPEPATLHRGIGRVGSGESFSYLPGGTFATRRYYQPTFRPTPTDSPEALYRRIREALRDSVHAHMHADEPVGALLSSGIDSTAIVAFAREVDPHLQTFTVGFDVPGYSELDIARDSAHTLGVANIGVKVGPRDVTDALPKIIWHLDDPVADPSLVPLYFVAKKAAQHVTVVLSGEGADEFFGGYGIYREPMALSTVAGLPDGVQRGLRRVAQVIPQGIKGRSFLERGTTPIEARYYGGARIFTEEEKQLLMRRYDPAVRYTDITAPVYAEAATLDDVTKMQYIDLYTWLRGDILVKADRMSQAHSLELRMPYVDREIFDIASTIPVELKVPPKSNATKYAMRRALDGVVPAAIVNRRLLGFPTPIRVWLRGELYEWARAVLAGSGAGDLIDLGYALNLLDEHKRGDRDNSRKVWTLLVFCLWHAIFVERSLDPGVPRGELPHATIDAPGGEPGRPARPVTDSVVG